VFIWAPLARQAKYAKLSRVILVFIAMQSLLALPVLFDFVRTPPDVFYPRIHGGPDFELFDSSWASRIYVVEDEIGFIDHIDAPLPGDQWPMIYMDTSPYHRVVLTTADESLTFEEPGLFVFVVTRDYFFYLDSRTMLSIPVARIPAWVIQEMNHRELFNHLTLANRYFTSTVMPIFLLIFIVFFLSQVLMTVAAVWLFGQWRKLMGKMTVKERFSVISFASVPAGLVGMLVGFVFPIVHILAFQLLMIYISYKAMKEF